jgi:hypothetical protein
VIGIALNVNNLWRDVLCLITNRINQYAATDRAIRTSRTRLGSSGDFQFFEFGISGLEIKTEDGGGRTTDSRDFEEISAGRLHRSDTSQDITRLSSTEVLVCPKRFVKIAIFEVVTIFK